jgi:hypothetical protein
MAVALIAALALSSLPLVFLRSDDKPASMNLPPFEKELYLSVSAKWAPNDCVDVTVVTNLPEGAVFVIGAQPRARPGTLRPFEPVDRVFTWTRMIPDAVTSPRMDIPSLFCGLVGARKRGEKRDSSGLMLEAYVDHTAHFYWQLPLEDQLEKQARLIGRDGSLLRGPLTKTLPNHIEGRTVTYAHSKTFILEPLPMLPENEEGEQHDENSIDSE